MDAWIDGCVEEVGWLGGECIPCLRARQSTRFWGCYRYRIRLRRVPEVTGIWDESGIEIEIEAWV